MIPGRGRGAKKLVSAGAFVQKQATLLFPPGTNLENAQLDAELPVLQTQRKK
jgi:hypothetical protein